MSNEAARARYLADKVNTATPAQLIVMLYDRLALDIEVAAVAQAKGDHLAASAPLLHGQRIVTELLVTLDTSVWTGADDLASLYAYILQGLMMAKAHPDESKLRALGIIVADLRFAWSGAAAQLSAASTAAAVDRRPAAAGAWVG